MWSKKGKIRDISSSLQGAVKAHELAHGDGSAFCSLCGSDQQLRGICHSYFIKGLEEKYDQLIYDCFGVKVTAPNSQICQECVKQLRSTCHFRSLVYAAFEKPLSERSSNNTAIDNFDYRSTVSEDDESLFESVIARKSVNEPQKPRKRAIPQNSVMKRANFCCSICKQKYLMFLPHDCQDFVCSRCKKNQDKRGLCKNNPEKKGLCKKCNLVLPEMLMHDHMALHAKANKRSKSKAPIFKKPSPMRVVRSPKRMYDCSQCEKKYRQPKNLAEHINSVHSDSLDCVCAVCGKDLKTRELLDQHLQIHTGEPLYQCDVCMRIFRNQRALQVHAMSHGMLKKVIK